MGYPRASSPLLSRASRTSTSYGFCRRRSDLFAITQNASQSLLVSVATIFDGLPLTLFDGLSDKHYVVVDLQ